MRRRKNGTSEKRDVTICRNGTAPYRGVGPGAEVVERGVRRERRPWREASVERGI